MTSTSPRAARWRSSFPGTGGTATVKNLVGIKFSKTDNPPVYSDIAVPSIEAGALINMNTSWFDNDGVQAKVGEP